MKKVALLTTFYEVQSGFSVIAVTETQIRMLLDHNYAPLVLVQDQYREDADGNALEPKPFVGLPPPSVWNKETVDLRVVIPPLKLARGVVEDFEDRVAKIYNVLKENLVGVDVCITEDIMLQDFYKEHNVAVRRYAKERPDLLWLHWLHSCPTPMEMPEYPENCRYTSPPGYLVYPNSSDAGLVCSTYNLGGREWKVKTCRAGHALDPLQGCLPLTRSLVQKADLLGGEVTAIYPARLDRGKQVEKAIHLMAGVKNAGFKPRFLVVAWQSSGERFQKYIDELLKLASGLGAEDNIHFSNRIDDRCSQGVPNQVVLELMRLTNVYIHPSRVETYSLVVHEAIRAGNLVILNHDLAVMRELFGDSGIYMDFGSDRVDRDYHPNVQAFSNNEAKRLISELYNNRALMAKTRALREWSPGALWKTMEPLFYLQPVGE